MTPSVRCARNKRLYPTVLQSLRSFLWMLDCAWMEYLLSTLWDVVIEVLHSTNNIVEPNHNGVDETRVRPNSKAKTQMTKERQRLINCQMWIMYTPRHTLLKASPSCTFLAKPKPIFPAKATPVNLVLRSPWSMRENPPQNLGHPVDPGNADEGQGSQTSTRKLVQAVTPKTEFTNHQYMTKIFHCLQKTLGISEAYSTFSVAALKM